MSESNSEHPTISNPSLKLPLSEPPPKKKTDIIFYSNGTGDSDEEWTMKVPKMIDIDKDKDKDSDVRLRGV